MSVKSVLAATTATFPRRAPVTALRIPAERQRSARLLRCVPTMLTFGLGHRFGRQGLPGGVLMSAVLMMSGPGYIRIDLVGTTQVGIELLPGRCGDLVMRLRVL